MADASAASTRQGQAPGHFGDLLRRHRQALGLTQEDLGDRARLSAREISDLERGRRRRPYPATVRNLADALGLRPPEREELAAAARGRGTEPLGRGEAAALAKTFTPRHNLPEELTSFVGRMGEVRELVGLLERSRLLTLTGTGGCGKTRLALQLAREVLDRYPDGCWLVEFASLTDPGLVPQSVAASLAIGEREGESLTTTIVRSLGDKRTLVLLDNCEHLVNACASLAELLLRACPGLRIVTTSRQLLGVAGEAAWHVPSLTTPDPALLPLPELIARYEAVQLFAERAHSVAPEFAMTPQVAAAVAELCQRLDGIPLAIELAAARVRVLTVEQVLERMNARFELLTAGARTSAPRHQTLRALVDWSYDLLLEPERKLFRRLSVFAGGWTLEAAEAVCGGNGIETGEILDLLSQLIEKSLVVAEGQSGHKRYRLLETLRQYSQEKLQASGEAPTIESAHAAFFLAVAATTDMATVRSWAARWWEPLLADYDNIRAVLSRARDSGDLEQVGLMLVGRLYLFWWVRNYWSEGRDWATSLLALPAAQRLSRARVDALATAGNLANWQGDLTAAMPLLQEGFDLAAELAYAAGQARLQLALTEGTVQRGDVASVPNLASELSRYLRDLDLPWIEIVGNVYHNTALALLGRFAEAWPLVDDGVLACARATGEVNAVAAVLLQRGRVFFFQRENGEAVRSLRESLDLFREAGNSAIAALPLGLLGELAMRDEDLRSAEVYVLDTLRWARNAGHRRVVAECLVDLAAVAATIGRMEWATTLLGAAEALQSAEALVLLPWKRVRQEQTTVSVRTALGDDAFKRLRAAGLAMRVDAVVGHVLSEAVPMQSLAVG